MESLQNALDSLQQLSGTRYPGATVLFGVLFGGISRHNTAEDVCLFKFLQVCLVHDSESCRKELAERAVQWMVL